ncbi:MAG: hypothetical protein ACRDY6_23025 [Acidimicrobiia bacterium]
MSEITITELEPGTFDVQVEEGHETTSHRVRLEADFLDEAGLDAVEREVVVRETFEFLLEREPASAIMSEFGLDDVQRFFPDYVEELTRRVG